MSISQRCGCIQSTIQLCVLQDSKDAGLVEVCVEKAPVATPSREQTRWRNTQRSLDIDKTKAGATQRSKAQSVS